MNHINGLIKMPGFTLLEVLVALAVLAVAMATLIKTSGYYTDNARYLRDKTLAHWVAMNVLTELQIQHKWPALGKQTGTATMAKRQWYWIVRTSKTPDKELRRLEVQVYYHPKDDEPITKLEGFMAAPLVLEKEMLLF